MSYPEDLPLLDPAIDNDHNPPRSKDGVTITVTSAGARQLGPSPPTASARTGWGSRAVAVLSFLMVWLVIGFLWEYLVTIDVLNGRVLVPPSSFLPYLLEGPGSAGIGYNKVTFEAAIVATMLRVFTGFVLGLAVALIGAILICAVQPVRLTLLPLARTMAPIAPVAWIPLAITLVGIGSAAAIFVVFIGSDP